MELKKNNSKEDVLYPGQGKHSCLLIQGYCFLHYSEMTKIYFPMVIYILHVGVITK